MVLLQESWTVVDQIAGKLVVFLTKKWMLGQLTPVKKLLSLTMLFEWKLDRYI